MTLLGIGTEITPPMINLKNTQHAMNIIRHIVKSDGLLMVYLLYVLLTEDVRC